MQSQQQIPLPEMPPITDRHPAAILAVDGLLMQDYRLSATATGWQLARDGERIEWDGPVFGESAATAINAARLTE